MEDTVSDKKNRKQREDAIINILFKMYDMSRVPDISQMAAAIDKSYMGWYPNTIKENIYCNDCIHMSHGFTEKGKKYPNECQYETIGEGDAISPQYADPKIKNKNRDCPDFNKESSDV
jgi:hypothetical protein